MWFSFGIYGSVKINPAGNPNDLWSMSIYGSTLCMLIVTCVIALETRYWVCFTHCAIWGSLILYAFGILILCSATAFNPGLFGVLDHLFWNESVIFALLNGLVVGVLPDFIIRVWKRFYYPTDAQILQEMDIKA